MTLLDIVAERPVAGGRMLARDQGRVVLVAGAIPGERVRARVERTVRHVLFATVDAVLEPSPFRRPVACDPACGGLAYVHIDPARQRVLKAAVVADAFRRIAGVAIDEPAVAGAEEHGYRLRARLHVRDGAPGFFREGSHVLCDAAATRQLSAEALPSVRALLAQLGPEASLCDAIVLAENVPASERVAHLELRAGARVSQIETRLDAPAGLTGVSAQAGGKRAVLFGHPAVTDTAGTLFRGSAPVDPAVRWTRSASSFFQGNRFLTGDLVAHVVAHVDGGSVLDLYAGVGLFAVALAASGRHVTAIEGDASSAEDLGRNAEPWAAALQVRHAAVETALSQTAAGSVQTVVLDPPRTGLSAAAMTGLRRLSAGRLVYVSCDPATLARDAKLIIAAGWRIGSVAGFDLFPNTPHIETVVVFDR